MNSSIEVKAFWIWEQVADRYLRGIERNENILKAQTFESDVLEAAEQGELEVGVAFNQTTSLRSRIRKLEKSLCHARSRGDDCSSLDLYLTRFTGREIAERVAAADKNEKQGHATIHDLGLAHSMYYLMQLFHYKKNCVTFELAHSATDRNSVLCSTSPYLGELVQQVRVLTCDVLSKSKSRPVHDITENELLSLGGGVATLIQNRINVLRKSSKRGIKYEKFDLSLRNWFNIYCCVKNFGLDKSRHVSVLEMDAWR